MGYKTSALKGVWWITLLRGCTRSLTFVRLAILGRILTPIEFGFFGIASLFLSFLEIFTETGINIFLIQNKSHIKEYIDSAWIVSMIRGVILALVILILAPFVAKFFNSPQSIGIISIIAFVPFIRGFINPAIISYQKDLKFHKEFGLRSVLFVIDVVVSVIVGYFTRSAMCFVYGQMAAAFAEVILSYVLIPLRPKLRFDFEQVVHIITKGFWVTLTGIFAYFADNTDNIAVGKIIGSGALGIYQVAYKVSTLPISEITNVVNQVIFPVYSKFSDDKNRLKRAFVRVTTVNVLGAFIFGIPIFLLARPIILILMGDQWIAAVPVIKILAIYGIARTCFGGFSVLFLSSHRQDYVAKMTFVRVIALAICVVPLVMSFGMVGAGIAMLISILIEIPIIIFFTYRVFR